jgi:hypothetical protein
MSPMRSDIDSMFEPVRTVESVAKPDAKGAKVQAIDLGNSKVDTSSVAMGPTVKESWVVKIYNSQSGPK